MQMWFLLRLAHLVLDVDAVEAVQVGFVAVHVPPASSIGHGTAGDGGCRVAVFGGEDLIVVVTQRVS